MSPALPKIRFSNLHCFVGDVEDFDCFHRESFRVCQCVVDFDDVVNVRADVKLAWQLSVIG
jgi:hypothetical protein